MPKKPKKGEYDAIIIGAGMGGLASAVYLGQLGYSVLVVESHNRPGGYAHSFRRKKFVFDSAVRIVAGAEYGLLSELLEKANLNMELNFKKMDDIYSVYYPDKNFTVPRSKEGLINAYIKQFPKEADNINRLVNEMEKIYLSTIEMLKEEKSTTIISNKIFMKYKNYTFHDMVSEYLDDSNAIYSFSALWAYFGTPPSKGSALFFAYAIMSYFKEDIYYLEGSFQNLATAFSKKIKSLNGEVVLNNEVTKINVSENSVQGVYLATNDYVKSNLVISNCDLTKTIFNLVGKDYWPKRYLNKISKLNHSTSAFEVFMGINYPLEKLNLSHETFIYNDYDYSEFERKHSHLKDLGPEALSGLAITTPTLIDPSLAPEGHHTSIITTLVPYDIGVEWDSVKEDYQNQLIKMAEKAIPNLSRHIVFVESGSPKTMERYTNNSNGAIYGWEQSINQMNKRPQHETPIKGLYLSGQWTNPGGGVVSVILSGYQLVEKLKKKGNSNEIH